VERNLEHYRKSLPGHIVDRLAVVPGDVNLHDALRAADVVYHVFSAAALEAMLLGVPVLFERGEGAPPLCDFPEMGGGLWATPDTAPELCRNLSPPGEMRDRCLDSQDTFIQRAMANLGRAAACVVAGLLRDSDPGSGPAA